MRKYLAKEERLNKKNIIQQLFKKGKSTFNYPFKLVYMENISCPSKPFPQVLFSIPKKKIKTAVQRNRIRRQIKEIYRLHKHLLAKRDNTLKSLSYLAIIYVATKPKSYHFMAKSMTVLLDQLNLLNPSLSEE